MDLLPYKQCHLGCMLARARNGLIINPQSAASSPLLDLHISWATCSLSIPHFNKGDILDVDVLVLFMLTTIDTGAILSLRLVTPPNNEDVNLFCLSLNQSLLFRWSLVETSDGQHQHCNRRIVECQVKYSAQLPTVAYFQIINLF